HGAEAGRGAGARSEALRVVTGIRESCGQILVQTESPMPAKSGHEAVVEQLLADGFSYIFGNPGTSEEGLLDAIERRPELKYVLTLQESIAVLAADGYARATNQPTAVQIHSTPGLGNAIGALYQASRG